MKSRVTPSLVISVIALIVALGGASYAAIKIPKNSVGTKQLKKNAVTAKKLKMNAVTAKKLKSGSVTASKLKDGSVSGPKLVDGSVTGSRIAPDAVNSSKVAAGSLLRSDFSPGQINGNAYYAERDADTLLPLTGGGFIDVVSTPVLPAGSYVIAGRANVVGGVANYTAICSLANDAAQNFTVGAGEVLPLSMNAVAVLSEPGQIVLSCQSGGLPQIAQAHVIATSVNSIAGFTPGG